MKFIASLRNGHTQFQDDQLDRRPLKFRLLDVDDQWVVVGSQESRLAPGTVVRTIDGRPVDDLVRDLSRYVAASNDRLARTHVFSYPGLFAERIALGLTDGRTVSIDRSAVSDLPNQSTARSSEARWLEPGQTAYLRITSFGDPVFERSAIELVRQYGGAASLVIDVRGNGGGATPRQLLEALMNRAWQTWQEATPQMIALFEANGIPTIQMARTGREQLPMPDAYGGRVLLLVDRFCGSACEDFVMPFKATGRAVIVGETTQGSSGNPYRADLGGGFRVTIGAVRYRWPDGAAFEGVGIDPDVHVDRTIADIRTGADPALQRAAQLASPSAGNLGRVP
jgi:carboxyl-terminal processing protease